MQEQKAGECDCGDDDDDWQKEPTTMAIARKYQAIEDHARKGKSVEIGRAHV